MKTIKGPGIFLAQFAGDAAPFNTLEGMAKWAAESGIRGRADSYLGQAPVRFEAGGREPGVLRRDSGRCGAGRACGYGAVHALAGAVGGQQSGLRRDAGWVCAAGVAGDLKGRQAWAVQQLGWAAKASRNLGLNAHATFSGALAWPYFYPWPQRPAGLIDEAFAELGRRWLPILNASLTRRAWTFATSCIPAKTCTTE